MGKEGQGDEQGTGGQGDKAGTERHGDGGGRWRTLVDTQYK